MSEPERREEDEYALIADLYDPVVPYRERTDVEFFVMGDASCGGPRGRPAV